MQATPDPIVILHLSVIVPCFILGTYLLISAKGTKTHTLLGKVYMILMAFTGVLTLFIPAEIGPRILDHFGFLHLLSLLTLWSVPTAWFAITRGNVITHKWAMISLYFGGIIIAGSFALFVEGRYLHQLIFSMVKLD